MRKKQKTRKKREGKNELKAKISLKPINQSRATRGARKTRVRQRSESKTEGTSGLDSLRQRAGLPRRLIATKFGTSVPSKEKMPVKTKG